MSRSGTIVCEVSIIDKAGVVRSEFVRAKSLYEAASKAKRLMMPKQLFKETLNDDQIYFINVFDSQVRYSKIHLINAQQLNEWEERNILLFVLSPDEKFDDQFAENFEPKNSSLSLSANELQKLRASVTEQRNIEGKGVFLRYADGPLSGLVTKLSEEETDLIHGWLCNADSQQFVALYMTDKLKKLCFFHGFHKSDQSVSTESAEFTLLNNKIDSALAIGESLVAALSKFEAKPFKVSDSTL